VKGLEPGEAFSASRIPKRSGARNIATPEYINIVKEENTASRGMPLESFIIMYIVLSIGAGVKAKSVTNFLHLVVL
jgi:hypothetical protein